jgi:site-specific DNA recombinase
VLEELDTAGVTFRSATEPFDTGSPAGRMMVQMLGVFAEFERATIIDRVIAGMERKAARGGWNGGGVPFGYRYGTDGFLEVNSDEATLIPVIFEQYVGKRLGARSIANLLTERGHRARTNRPWSFRGMLTVLRNRVYLGEVFFRDAWHPAPHPRLIDDALFEAAQRLLEERGEDYARRRTNPSEYLLGGLVVCTNCGHRMVGSAAQGKIYRYRYYTCYKKQRYGQSACPSERIDADQLDLAIQRALLAAVADQRLIDDAVADFLARTRAALPSRQSELTAVRSEVRKTDEKLDRYFQAFETGAMTQDACAPRIAALNDQLRSLRGRQAELSAAVEDEYIAVPTPAELAEIRAMVTDGMRDAPIPQRKAILQKFVSVSTDTSDLTVP